MDSTRETQLVTLERLKGDYRTHLAKEKHGFVWFCYFFSFVFLLFLLFGVFNFFVCFFALYIFLCLCVLFAFVCVCLFVCCCFSFWGGVAFLSGSSSGDSPSASAKEGVRQLGTSERACANRCLDCFCVSFV